MKKRRENGIWKGKEKANNTTYKNSVVIYKAED